MKLLAIDRGNSRTKVGVQQNDGSLVVNYFANEAEDHLLSFIEHQHAEATVMSSVAATGLPNVSQYLKAKSTFLFVDSQTPTPIKNHYATPETLGSDRIAGAIGAWTLSHQQDVLLMDAGTCINYECVVNHTYIGGAIAPGLRMRLKAMHTFTGKLPLLDLPETAVELTGKSTTTCLLSGAVIGMAHEMQGIENEYKALYPGIAVVLSGGDAAYLGKYLKNSIFAPHKEVVLVGLLEILKYNLNVKS